MQLTMNDSSADQAVSLGCGDNRSALKAELREGDNLDLGRKVSKRDLVDKHSL